MTAASEGTRLLCDVAAALPAEHEWLRVSLRRQAHEGAWSLAAARMVLRSLLLPAMTVGFPPELLARLNGGSS